MSKPNKFKRGLSSHRNVDDLTLENKNVSVSVSALGAGGTGTVDHLTAIPQGLDFDERIGNRISLLRVDGRVILSCNVADTTTQDSAIRLIIVRDKMAQGSVPVFTDIFDAISVHDMRNGLPDNLKRYDILYDSVTMLGNDSSNAGIGIANVKFSTFSIPCNNSKCAFVGAAAADEGPGSLFFLTVTNKSANLPAIAARFRVYYRN
jgi:hypothetical protein